MHLKLLFKRGALLAAANWPAVAIQFAAEITFQMLLAVPVVGAAVIVAVLLGGDLADLLAGSLREIIATLATTLVSQPFAFVAFSTAFIVVLLGGSILTFLVKGGIVDVMIAAETTSGPVEREPMTFETFRHGLRFTLDRFMNGCRRLHRRYVELGFWLIGVYVVSGALYLAFVLYGYRVISDRLLVIEWTFVAAVAALVLVAWITVVNLFYLLTQIAIAVDDVSVRDGVAEAIRFVRADVRELAGVLGVVVVMIIGAQIASALSLSGVGLIAFIPLVGLAVFPLQIAALLIRGLVFEYLGLTALGAYLALYLAHRQRRPLARKAPMGQLVTP